MNIYAIIILAALITGYVISILTGILNIRSLKPDLPEEFNGVYDAEKYKKSQEYTRVNTRFGLVTSTLDLLITLAFWFTGGFRWLDEWVRHFDLTVIWSGLLFVAILLIGKSILSFPFSVYSTFVIEARFGFNKTTVKTFIMDRVKGMLLGVLIGGPLLAGLIWFFEYAGPNAWLYAWLAVTVFSLLLQYIAPRWIMPLFNKFTPLEDGSLREKIMTYAQSVTFAIKDVFVIDGSKRSSKSNAFFTGFGKNKRIALYDTLIENQTEDELVAVLAHEIGHYKKKHIIQSMVISILHTGVMFYLMSLFLTQRGLFEAFYLENISVYAGLLFFSMLYSPIELLLGIVMQIFSRKNEFEADRFAAETIADKEAMVSALKKLSVHNLSNLTPHPLTVFLNYSHPPVLQRIQAIRAVAIENTIN